jgi:hypothetical protein
VASTLAASLLFDMPASVTINLGRDRLSGHSLGGPTLGERHE